MIRGVFFIINQKVRHTVFGNGTVLAMTDKYLTVLFDNGIYGEKVFVYPDCFESFLVLDDETLQEKSCEDLKSHRKQLRDEKARDEAEDRRHQENIAEARLEFNKKRPPAAKPDAKPKAASAKTKKTAGSAKE